MPGKSTNEAELSSLVTRLLSLTGVQEGRVTEDAVSIQGYLTRTAGGQSGSTGL